MRDLFWILCLLLSFASCEIREWRQQEIYRDCIKNHQPAECK